MLSPHVLQHKGIEGEQKVAYLAQAAEQFESEVISFECNPALKQPTSLVSVQEQYESYKKYRDSLYHNNNFAQEYQNNKSTIKQAPAFW